MYQFRTFQGEWNSFLKDVDAKSQLQTEDELGLLHEGENLPLDMAFHHLDKQCDITLKELIGSNPVLVVLLRHMS